MERIGIFDWMMSGKMFHSFDSLIYSSVDIRDNNLPGLRVIDL